MIINHNIAALNTFNALNNNTTSMNSALAKLSSGQRINSAADDAAGLAISQKMQGQINGLDQASTNAQDGISMVQTAEGALNETQSILQRMRELATQSANDTNTSQDRQNIQQEVDQLSTEITRISNTTEFNKQTLLNGGISSGNLGTDTLQIGANTGQSMTLSIGAMDAKSLGVSRDVATATLSGATDVTTATVSGSLGDDITNGASITLTAAVSTAGTVATAGAIGGITYATADNSDSLNGYAINITNGATAGSETATVDKTSKVINLKLSDTAGTQSTAAQINTALNNALATAGITDVQFAATGAVTAGAGAGTGTITGGAQDQITLTMTKGADTETKVVAGNATTASFTGAHFKGITLALNGNLSSGAGAAATTSAAATLTIAATYSTSTTFANGQKTADAVAAGGIDVSSSSAAASNAITTIDTAIQAVSAERATLGAYQNRLQHTINNLNTSSQNLTSASSRITDVDMAKEMSQYTKNSILVQAATAMLAQANQQPQTVLSLLK